MKFIRYSSMDELVYSIVDCQQRDTANGLGGYNKLHLSPIWPVAPLPLMLLLDTLPSLPLFLLFLLLLVLLLLFSETPAEDLPESVPPAPE